MHIQTYLIMLSLLLVNPLVALQTPTSIRVHHDPKSHSYTSERHPTTPSSRKAPTAGSKSEQLLLIGQHINYFEAEYASCIKFHMDQLLAKLHKQADRTKRVIILDIDDTLLSMCIKELKTLYKYHLYYADICRVNPDEVTSIKNDFLYCPAVPLMVDYVQQMRALGYILVAVTGRTYTCFHEMTALNLEHEGFGIFHNASWYFKHGLRTFKPPEDYLRDSIFHMPDRLERTTEATAAWKHSVYVFLQEEGYSIESWVDDMEYNFEGVDVSKTNIVHIPNPKDFPSYNNLINALVIPKRESSM